MPVYLGEILVTQPEYWWLSPKEKNANMSLYGTVAPPWPDVIGFESFVLGVKL